MWQLPVGGPRLLARLLQDRAGRAPAVKEEDACCARTCMRRALPVRDTNSEFGEDETIFGNPL
jgi:hypothetical protein